MDDDNIFTALISVDTTYPDRTLRIIDTEEGFPVDEAKAILAKQSRKSDLFTALGALLVNEAFIMSYRLSDRSITDQLLFDMLLLQLPGNVNEIEMYHKAGYLIPKQSRIRRYALIYEKMHNIIDDEEILDRLNLANLGQGITRKGGAVISWSASANEGVCQILEAMNAYQLLSLVMICNEIGDIQKTEVPILRLNYWKARKTYMALKKLAGMGNIGLELAQKDSLVSEIAIKAENGARHWLEYHGVQPVDIRDKLAEMVKEGVIICGQTLQRS